MSEEDTTPPEIPSEEPKVEGPPRAEWKYKTEFGIVNEMRNVLQLTLAASEAELKMLRRKLQKLQYKGGGT